MQRQTRGLIGNPRGGVEAPLFESVWFSIEASMSLDWYQLQEYSAQQESLAREPYPSSVLHLPGAPIK